MPHLSLHVNYVHQEPFHQIQVLPHYLLVHLVRMDIFLLLEEEHSVLMYVGLVIFALGDLEVHAQ